MKIEKPANFVIIPGEGFGARGHLIDPVTGERYLLSNRRWKEVNRAFLGVPSRIIKSLLQRATISSPVTVLDIGAGEKAQAASDLAVKYQKKPDKLHVLAVDLTAALDHPSKASQIRGNAFHLPLRDNTIDLAYSRQSVTYAAEGSSPLLRQSLYEAARVLKPGGIFFIDDDRYTDTESDAPELNRVIPDGTTLYATPAGVRPILNLQSILRDNKFPFEYLALIKDGPLNPLEDLPVEKHFRLLGTGQ